MNAQAWMNWLVAGILMYFLITRTGSFLLNLLSIRQLRDIEREKLLADLPQLQSGLEQPISILLPLPTGENPDRAIATIRMLLQLDHPAYELIVINDGVPEMMHVLTRAFDLHPFPEIYRMRIPTRPHHGMHRSPQHRNLRVIDKHAGGRADALNAGVNAARYPLCCSVDTGMILRRDFLQWLAAPFLNETGTVAAVAALRVANDAVMVQDSLEQLGLLHRWLPRLQLVESLRSALFAPLGWAAVNALPHSASGLALLRTDALMQSKGYDVAAVDPHTELIVRLQRTLPVASQFRGLHFIGEPICARIVAASWQDWRQQRTAWQQGLRDTLHRNRRWPAHSGIAGWLAYPFTLLSEVCGPLIETAAYLFMLLMLITGLLPMQVFCAFLTVAVGFGILLSLCCVLLEEMSFRSYPAIGDVTALVCAAVLFNAGYAQLDAACRAVAMLRRPQNEDGRNA